MDKEKEKQDSVNEKITENADPQNTKEGNVDDAAAETDKKADETDEVDNDLAELQKKCDTLHNDYLRLYADFDNYKKRTLKEKSDLIKSAGENIFNNLLPLIDDFERAQKAMDGATDVESVKEGVNLIYNKFISFLSQNGVKQIETEGKEFNTDFHEAIAKIPAPTDELKGKVVDCTQKGYTLNEKVIRYAKVVIGE